MLNIDPQQHLTWREFQEEPMKPVIQYFWKFKANYITIASMCKNDQFAYFQNIIQQIT